MKIFKTFAWVGIALMFVLLMSYGQTLIFNNFTTSYFKQDVFNNTGHYVFDFKSWIDDISTNHISNIWENFFTTITGVRQPINSIKNIWEDGYDVGDIVKSIINVGALIWNGIVLIFNMITSVIQILASMIVTTLNFIGIKTSGNTDFFEWLNDYINGENGTLIPYWNGVS